MIRTSRILPPLVVDHEFTFNARVVIPGKAILNYRASSQPPTKSSNPQIGKRATGMNESEATPQTATTATTVTDPVCGMTVEPAQARGKARYQDGTYYFCSPGCMHRFISDPGKFLSASDQTDDKASESGRRQGSSTKPLKDPVCGMTVDSSKAAASIEHGGTLYHFCSKGCAEKFKSDPEKYRSPTYKPGGMQPPVELAGRIRPAPKPESTSAPRTDPALHPTTYVCPMDPEVHQSYPGACPKCGMALEPDVPVITGKTLWTCPMHPE